MSIGFGKIIDYNRRERIGKVECNNSVFTINPTFHIENFDNTPYKKMIKSGEWKRKELFLWFTITKLGVTERIKDIWINSKMLNEQLIAVFLERNLAIFNNQLYLENALADIFNNHQSFIASKEGRRLIEQILRHKQFSKEPLRISKILPASFKEYFANALGLRDLLRESDQPKWIEEVTKDLLDEEGLKEFLQYKKLGKEEKELIEKQILNELIKKYNKSTDGIREEQKLSNICIKCGSTNVMGQNSFRVCGNCEAKWYINHCWNCSENIDSRDSLNPECTGCGWYKCACGACGC